MQEHVILSTVRISFLALNADDFSAMDSLGNVSFDYLSSIVVLHVLMCLLEQF